MVGIDEGPGLDLVVDLGDAGEMRVDHLLAAMLAITNGGREVDGAERGQVNPGHGMTCVVMA